jgi:drug/metabolite transporter (DMT)-like permease
MMKRHDHLDTFAMLVMVGLCAAWGLNQTATKIANAEIPPVLQAGLRGAGAATLLVLWSSARRVPLFQRDGSLWLGLLIGTLFALEFALLNGGLVFTTASRAIIFMYLAPFVVALGAHRFIPGERIGPSQLVGLLCAFGGMATAFADGLALSAPKAWLGDAMVIAAAMLWGATTVVVKASRLTRISPHKVLLYQLAGSAVLLPVSPLLGERGSAAVSPVVLAALAYQTLFVAFVTYLAWFWLVAHYPASRLSAFSFLAPLFGVLAGNLVLGETVTPLLVAALVLVGVGIYLVNRRPRAQRAARFAPQPQATAAGAPGTRFIGRR